MRNRFCTIFILFLLLPFSISGKENQDSTSSKAKLPMFLALKMEPGFVLKTNDFVKNRNISNYSAIALKYGIGSRGDRWQDIAYGMPYTGIGLYTATFYEKDLGIPFSIFLFQGAKLGGLCHWLTFHYEFNLGLSTSWNAYDRFDNPENIAIGSSENVHVNANLYAKFMLSRRWDINIGASLTHFSNGATRMPNKGMNLVSPYVELLYKFNDPERIDPTGNLIPPKVEKRIDHDFLLTLSSRQIYYSKVGTGLSTQYIDHKFRIVGLSYAAMVVNNYKYKWGPSLELVYDESVGATACREQHPEDKQYYDRVKVGKTADRFSLGISAKGEIVMPHFSFFANLGYDILHKNENDSRFYQILGIKLNINERIFGTFGIRATRFSRAQYFFWSAGYTLKGKPFKGQEKSAL